jgi:hypothetical protein
VFVFCGLRGVLLPEFGDLILRNSWRTERGVRARGKKVVARKWPDFVAQGKDIPTQGKPVAAQGKPFAAQGKPFAAQGKPFAAQGKPFAAQGKQEWRLPFLNCLLRRLFLCCT